MRKDLEQLLELTEEMKGRLENSPERYRQLASQVKTQVVRWEWCSTIRYSPQPFGAERSYGGKRGRVLSQEPEKKSGKYRYGFSSDDRVLVGEQYTDLPNQSLRYETFWEHAEGRIDTTEFHYSSKEQVIHVGSTFFEAGRARGFIRYAEGGMSLEVHDYQEGLLVSVHTAQKNHNHFRPDEPFILLEERLSYRNGQLVQIEREWEPGGAETVKIAPERTVVANLRRDAERVGNYIRKQVAKLAKKPGGGPVSRINLGFGHGDSNFVSLHLDTRPKAEPDGEWTHHIEENPLEMPQWEKIVDAWGDRPICFLLPDGTERHISGTEEVDDEGLAALFGDMLKEALVSARTDGVFERLPKADGCELGVEEVNGNYGWPRYEDRGKENGV